MSSTSRVSKQLSTIDASPVIKIQGRIFIDDGYPPQDIIDQLIPCNFIGVNKNYEWAKTYLKQVKKQMDENPDTFDVKVALINRPKIPLDANEPSRFPPRPKTQSL